MQQAFSRYLKKRGDLERWPLHPQRLDDIDTVIVIPCLAERKNIPKTLTSLAACDPERLRHALIVCVVNNREDEHAVAEDIADNHALLADLGALVEGRDTDLLAHNAISTLRLAFIDASSAGNELPKKDGVGLARKIGLDWGVSILAASTSQVRLLCSLDADTTVAQNYLSAVYDAFNHASAWAGVVHFEHPLPEDSTHRQAIVGYESFLRCHVHGLRLAGSPYAFHTVGSTMVCTPEAYVAVSGMNRRQAAEDFYFLQQLAKTGEMKSIATTTVYPSARSSHRVPFGTGRSVRNTLENSSTAQETYAPQSYDVLKQCLALVTLLDTDVEEVLRRAAEFDNALPEFLRSQDIAFAWPRMRRSSSTGTQRVRQFHTWFDAFRVLKLIHFLRDNGMPNVDIRDAARMWARSEGVATNEPEALLMWLREQDRAAADGIFMGLK